jgi:hypothetical protein
VFGEIQGSGAVVEERAKTEAQVQSPALEFHKRGDQMSGGMTFRSGQAGNGHNQSVISEIAIRRDLIHAPVITPGFPIDLLAASDTIVVENDKSLEVTKNSASSGL